MSRDPISNENIVALIRLCGPLTVAEIADMFHVTKRKARVYVDSLRFQRQLHIVRWLAPGSNAGRSAAVHGLCAPGDDKDAPNPWLLAAEEDSLVDDRSVMRVTGVNPKHVAVAQRHADLGVWGGLLR
jgi:hypothetical protein